MLRVTARYLPPDVAVFGVIETVLSFAAIDLMITFARSAALPAGFGDLFTHDSVPLAAGLAVSTCGAAFATGLYRIDVCSDYRRLAVTSGLVAAVAYAILFGVSGTSLAGVAAGETVLIAKILGVWLATVTLIRMAYGATAERGTRLRRVLIVGEAHRVSMLQARLRCERGARFEPVTLDAADLSWATVRRQRLWGVVVASDPSGPATQPMLAPLLDCKLRGLPVLDAACFHETHLGRMQLETLTAADLLAAPGFAVTRIHAVLKRLTDILIGSALLVLALPLMLLTAVAIKLDSPGPVLYRQQRIGRFGATFTLAKFRSMNIDAEAGGKPRWAEMRDPRITRIGRFIRATRIDELPQLANVIRGEMSLVGPRPERPHFVRQLTDAIPFYQQRGYAKPGLTGWAQVNFPYGASIEDAREKLAYDLYYVKHASFRLDAAILLSTIRVVLFGIGAR